MEQSQQVPPPSLCLNCKQPLPEDASYCPACSQKCTTGRVTVLELVYEFFQSIFNFDSKIFKTLAALAMPGKLTVEYFKGRHKSYLHPVRLFLVAIIALIAVISFQSNMDDSLNVSKALRIQERFERKQIQLKIDSLSQEIKQEFSSGMAHQALDSLNIRLALRDSSQQDSIELDRFFKIANEKSATISNEDYLTLSADTLIEKYHIEGFWNQLIFRQKLKFVDKSSDFIRYLIGRISWLVFLVIPLFSLAFMLFYFRSKRYYVEHFIFLLHVHTFLFVLISLFVLFQSMLPDWVIPVLSLIGMLYIVLAQKKVYQQGYLKTCIKAGLLAGVYLILLTVCMVITVLAGSAFLRATVL